MCGKSLVFLEDRFSLTLRLATYISYILIVSASGLVILYDLFNLLEGLGGTYTVLIPVFAVLSTFWARLLVEIIEALETSRLRANLIMFLKLKLADI